ncbi:MAG: universal stress protein [Halobacteriota archaeon]
MGMRILLPYDGSEQADRAIEYAIDQFEDATFVLMSVINPAESVYLTEDEGMAPFPENWYETARDQTEQMLDRAIDELADAAVSIERDVVVGRPTRAIVEYVEEHDIDHVVMGSHGRSGVSRLLLGSVAESVIRRSPVPVTVVR